MLNDVDAIMTPPKEGGRGKQIVSGLIVPVLIWIMAAKCWIDQEALWFGQRQSGTLTVDGRTAQAVAVVYFAVGVFCHFRWFWGLVPAYRVFTTGTIAAIVLGLGGCGAAFYNAFV